jgi:hypothetical protein
MQAMRYQTPGLAVLAFATIAGLGFTRASLAQAPVQIPPPNLAVVPSRPASAARSGPVAASPTSDPALRRTGFGNDAVASPQSPVETCAPPAPSKPQPSAPTPVSPPAPMAPQYTPQYVPQYAPYAPQYAPYAPQYVPMAPVYMPQPPPAPVAPHNVYVPTAPSPPPSYAPVAPQPVYMPMAPQPAYIPVAPQPAYAPVAPAPAAALTNQTVSVPTSRSTTRTRVRGPGLINSSLARLGERLTQLGRTRIETVQETELAPSVAQPSGGLTTISTTGLVPQPPPPTAPVSPPPPPPTAPQGPTPSPQCATPQPQRHSLIQHLLGHD